MVYDAIFLLFFMLNLTFLNNSALNHKFFNACTIHNASLFPVPHILFSIWNQACNNRGNIFYPYARISFVPVKLVRQITNITAGGGIMVNTIVLKHSTITAGIFRAEYNSTQFNPADRILVIHFTA